MKPETMWEMMTNCVIVHNKIMMSVMIASMIKGGNFMVNWWSRSLGQQHLHSSTICIIRCLIAVLTLNFKWI
jgi:hypothetical protein